jgi:hypothetical protein
MTLKRSLRAATAIVALARPGYAVPCQPDNDATVREAIWRRFDGDAWAAYDALPPSVRGRIQCHAYDAWSVNALVLWRRFRRQTASSQRAERRLLRHLDECEALEREAFAETYARRHGTPLPHLAAGASVLRCATARRRAPC